MPMLTRECLAHRFRQNWLAKNPGDTVVGSQLDDSLTSLSWLQNLNIMKLATPTPPASPSSITDRVPLATPASAVFNNNITNSHTDANDLRVNPNAVLNMTNMNGRVDVTSPGVDSGYTSICRTLGRVEVHPPQTTTHVDKVDYKTNPFVKPPYSYATLICMAMKESKRNKITLSGIYSWITDNFMYYRVADPSWQNSIRHNLSLNKCFQKVPRRKDEPGKGGFWRINPEYSDMFVNGIFKKRRSSTRENVAPAPAPAAKRFKRDSDEVSLQDATRLLNSPYIKSEPEEAVRHLAVSEGMTEALSGDFSWNAILQQDIQVGGVRIKTEDIIDNNIDDSKLAYEAEYAASPITELSPPPSDSNSDVGLDDLLSTDLEPVDLSNGDPLDLTVQGQSIQPPEWWNESLTRGIFTHLAASHSSSGLHTPLASSPIHETDYSHPWAENRSDLDEAIANFDLDLQNLFEDDSLTGPVLCDS